MTAPRVSIGLPVYNGEKYLAEAIESVLAQTYTDFDLVISDNASNDATEEICRDFAARHDRIRYVRHSQNGGAAWNFNQTFELSRGEYFKWLAHDDVIGPGYLTAAVELLDVEPAAVLCHSRTGIIDQHGELVFAADSNDLESLAIQGTTPQEEFLRRASLQAPSAHERFLGVLLRCIRCHEVFGVIRRSAMRQTGLHRNYCGGEKVFMGELSLHGAFLEVPQLLAFSRWHADRFSANTSARAQDLHMDPHAKRGLPLPRQLRSAWGHWNSISRTRLNWWEKVRCRGALGRYVLQTKKWPTILSDYRQGLGQLARLPELSANQEGKSTAGPHWKSINREFAMEVAQP